MFFNDFTEHFNFIYFGPKSGNDKSVPLIIVPHGGPHSNYANSFILDYFLLVLSGKLLVCNNLYSTICLNYS